MSGPSVYLRLPPLSLFHFPPSSAPKTLPPPIDEGSLRSPFGISPGIYNDALSPAVPIVFASCYIIAVWLLNTYNRRRSKGKFDRPWWVATTKPFKWFVVVHNVLLALYSLATFVAMARAITATLNGTVDSSSGAWPAQVADALCKMHGPRGLGDSASYNTTINIWESKNALIHLDHLGNPDPTDVGRLWNEGLAFWGWWFYMSKFYEVVDTLIIIAKGKRSATLQTYHHAGAMLCMWAGIRYMSPPIWMFVFINSGIHAMMYTYFTLAALNIRVSQTIKRTLTTLQIAQFIFGASYAAAHLFVQYDIPVQTPYQVVSTIQEIVSRASAAGADASSAVSAAIESPTITASIGAVIKKYLLRAAGEEGIAEQVPVSKNWLGQQVIPSPMAEKIQEVKERTYHETRWRRDWTKIDCIDTTGEAFAIYLNLFYLFPLTALFARFFYKAYTRRGRPRSFSKGARQAYDAGNDAQKSTRRSIEQAGEYAEEELERRSSQAADAVKDANAQETLDAIKEDMKKLKDGTLESGKRQGKRAAAQAGEYEQKAEDLVAAGVEKAKEAVNGARGSSEKAGGQESPANGEKGAKDEGAEGEGAAEAEKADADEADKGQKENGQEEVAGKQEEEGEQSKDDGNGGDADVPKELGNEQNEPAKLELHDDDDEENKENQPPADEQEGTNGSDDKDAPEDKQEPEADPENAEPEEKAAEESKEETEGKTAEEGGEDSKEEESKEEDKAEDAEEDDEGQLGDSSIVDLGIPEANSESDLKALDEKKEGGKDESAA